MTLPLRDPIAASLERGWRVLGGRHRAVPAALDCDVPIVGSGAGARITAPRLRGRRCDQLAGAASALRLAAQLAQRLTGHAGALGRA